MLSARKAAPAVVIVALIAVGGYVVTRFNGQEAAIQSADFGNAVTAAVRNAQCEIVRRGIFMLVEEEDDDIEWKAALAATTGGEVMGEAEVEFATEMPADKKWSSRLADSSQGRRMRWSWTDARSKRWRPTREAASPSSLRCHCQARRRPDEDQT